MALFCRSEALLLLEVAGGALQLRSGRAAALVWLAGRCSSRAVSGNLCVLWIASIRMFTSSIVASEIDASGGH